MSFFRVHKESAVIGELSPPPVIITNMSFRYFNANVFVQVEPPPPFGNGSFLLKIQNTTDTNNTFQNGYLVELTFITSTNAKFYLKGNVQNTIINSSNIIVYFANPETNITSTTQAGIYNIVITRP
jgi:hypothetical protein